MSHRVPPARIALVGISVFACGVIAGGFFQSHAQGPNAAAISAIVPETPFNTPQVRALARNPLSNLTPDQIVTLGSSFAAVGVLSVAGVMWRRSRTE